MDTIGRPLLSSSFQEGSTVLWFGFIVLSRTILLSFSLLVRKQTLTSVGYNCCRAIHTCPYASILPGGTQVLLRYLLFPLCHARKREGMWWVVAPVTTLVLILYRSAKGCPLQSYWSILLKYTYFSFIFIRLCHKNIIPLKWWAYHHWRCHSGGLIWSKRLFKKTKL